MKSFKDHVQEINELKIDSKTYQTFVNTALKNLNMMIEYGRKVKMDNKQLNPLLDAVKNIHNGDDAIRKAKEEVETPEKKEEKKPKKEW